MKPREFWIDADEDGNMEILGVEKRHVWDDPPKVNRPGVHVIEYAAYERALAMLTDIYTTLEHNQHQKIKEYLKELGEIE